MLKLLKLFGVLRPPLSRFWRLLAGGGRCAAALSRVGALYSGRVRARDKSTGCERPAAHDICGGAVCRERDTRVPEGVECGATGYALLAGLRALEPASSSIAGKQVRTERIQSGNAQLDHDQCQLRGEFAQHRAYAF